MFAFVNSVSDRVAGEARAVRRAGTAVRLDAVAHDFIVERRKVPVLAPLSLDIAAGQFVCVVGPSGSGKSTLLNVLAGLLRPTAGRVLEGAAVVQGPGPDRTVVFQDAALFPWLTLRGNVEFPLRLRRVPAGERAARVDELLRLVHLSRHAGSFPHELSGGMRQRGAIARALATDPPLLLMDEPFGALDPQTREILHDELEKIWVATGKTIVFVTHNVNEAVRLGDRVLVMAARPGRIAADVAVDLPRPRGLADACALEIAGDITERIARLVDEAAREEEESAWMVSGPALRGGARPVVGGCF